MKENSTRKPRTSRKEKSDQSSNSVKQRMKQKTRDNNVDQGTSTRLRSRSQLNAASSQSPSPSGRKRSRQSNSEDRSPFSDKIEELIQRTTPNIVSPRTVNGILVDPYCWVCHKLTDEHYCEICPRVYHQDCLKKLKLGDHVKCECSINTVGDRSSKIPCHPVELKTILLSVIDEAFKGDKKNSSKKNQERGISRLNKQLFKWHGNVSLVKIVDVLSLHTKTGEAPFYGSTGEFFMDVKWIYHNCCIVYGPDSETTQAALSLEKSFKRELLDVEACWECYYKRHAENSFQGNPFTSVCRKPHPIVWAKMRGSPFWPAKCLKKDNNHAEVWFFGTHDKAKVMLSQVLKISKKPPNKFISQQKYREALAELEIYISNYRSKFGHFEYSEEATPLNDVQSKNSRGKTRKGRYRAKSPKATSGEESADENESLAMTSEPENELSRSSEKEDNIIQGIPQKKQKSIMIKGIEQDITGSLENRKKPQLNLSVLHEDQLESESKVHLRQTFLKLSEQLAERFSDGKERSSSGSGDNISERNLVCHMTFSADEDTSPKGNMTVESPETSSESQVSASEAEGTSAANSGPSNSLFNNNSGITMKSSDQSHYNLSSSSNLPVIISTTSSSNENYASKVPIVPTNDSKKNSVFVAEAADRSSKLLQIVDQLLQTPETEEEEEEEEIVYVGESSGKSEPILKKSLLKKEISAKAMNELMLSSRPTMRNHLQGLVNTIVEHYLTAYMDFFRQPLESDFRTFISVYQKWMKKTELLNILNFSLKNENLSLKNENHSLKNDFVKLQEKLRHFEAQNLKLLKQIDEVMMNDDQKKQLHKDIIKNITENTYKDQIKFLEEEMQRLKKLKDEENEILKSKLKELEDTVKELQSCKESDTANKHLCEENFKIDVSCQTDVNTETSNKLEQDSEKESADEVCSYKKLEMLEFSGLNNAVPNPSQQPFYSDVQHSMVMIQQTTVAPAHSSASLTGTVVCESSNLIMTESSFIGQPVVPVLSSSLNTFPVVVQANPVIQHSNITFPTTTTESIQHQSSSSTAKSRQSKKTVRHAAKNSSSRKRQKK